MTLWSMRLIGFEVLAGDVRLWSEPTDSGLCAWSRVAEGKSALEKRERERYTYM